MASEFRPLSARTLYWQLRARRKSSSHMAGSPRRLLVEQLESRALLAVDVELPLLATATDAQQTDESAEVALLAAAGEAEAVPGIVELGLSITSPSGTPLARLSPGEDFVLHVTAQDVRNEARGVFAAYLDLTWDPALAVVTGPIRTTANFPNVVSGTVSTPGMVDEAGATGNGVMSGAERLEVFAIPMRALASGRLRIASDPAEESPLRDVLVHGLDHPVAVPAVAYGAVEALIDGPPVENPAVTIPYDPDKNNNPPAATGVGDDPSPLAVAIRLWITDGAGKVIEQVAPGEEFVLHAAVADVRHQAAGVFSAFVDVTWDSTLAEVSGGLAYGPDFTNLRTGQASAGQLDEAGGVAGLAEVGGGEKLLFSVLMRARAEGTLILSSDAADVLPLHQVLVYRSNDPVSGDRIQYGTAVLQISAAAAEGATSAASPLPDAGDQHDAAAGAQGAALLSLLEDSEPLPSDVTSTPTASSSLADHRLALATAETLAGGGLADSQTLSLAGGDAVGGDAAQDDGTSDDDVDDSAEVLPPLL